MFGRKKRTSSKKITTSSTVVEPKVIEEHKVKVKKVEAPKVESPYQVVQVQKKGMYEVRKNDRLIYSNPSKENADRFIKARP